MARVAPTLHEVLQDQLSRIELDDAVLLLLRKSVVLSPPCLSDVQAPHPVCVECACHGDRVLISNENIVKR